TFGAGGPATFRLLGGLAGAKSVQKPTDAITAKLLDRVPGVLASQHTAMLHFFNVLIEVAHLPTGEQEARFKGLKGKLPEEAYLVRVLAPAFMSVHLVQQRHEAILRTALVGLAAERFRLAQGRWPEALE